MSIWACLALANWTAMVAVGAAVLARRFRYGGMPQPAEWLPLIMLGMLARRALPHPIDLIRQAVQVPPPGDIAAEGFLLVMGVATLAAGGLWLASSPGPSLGGGTRTMVVAAALQLLAWGPGQILEPEGPHGIHGGSGPPGAILSAEGFHIAHAVSRLVLAVPFVMAISPLWRADWPPRRWTEQAATIGAVVGAILLVIRSMEIGTPASFAVDLAYSSLLIVVAVPLATRAETLSWSEDGAGPTPAEEIGFMATEGELLGTWERRNALMRQRLELRPGGGFAWSVHPGPPVIGALYLSLLPAAIKASREGSWELAGKAFFLQGFPGPTRLVVDEEGGEIVLRQGEPGRSPLYRRTGPEASR